MTREQYSQFLRQLQDNVKSNPGSAEAWRDLAQLKMMGGDADGAVNDCLECLRIDQKNVNGLVLMGNIFANYKKDDKTAAEYYERALAVDPENPDALGNYATMLMKLGEIMKAIPNFRRAIELKPDGMVAYYMLAQCYVSMEDWRSAWQIATDAFDKARIGLQDANYSDRIQAGLAKIRDLAASHGGDQPPENNQKHLEQSLRQTAFEHEHESQSDPQLNMMMAMYMMGAMKRFDALPFEKVREIAIEIAVLGTQGISPQKHSGYTLKSIPGEDFSGYRLLANYYVSWKMVFPDKLSMLRLPFDEAYKLAMVMRGNKDGENSKKQTGGV